MQKYRASQGARYFYSFRPCRYFSNVWLTTELAVLENANPSVRQQAGSKGRDTTPGQPNACITNSCEMVTPSPLRTNAMIRVSSRKLYAMSGFTGHLSIRCWMSLSQPGAVVRQGHAPVDTGEQLHLQFFFQSCHHLAGRRT